MYKNVIFDMGNVLLTFDPEVVLNHFCLSEESRALIRKELFEGPEWIMGDQGLLKNHERFAPISKRIPSKYHDELLACVNGWDMCMHPVPGAKDFCTLLKEKGYQLYVLSNADNTFHDYFPRFAEESWFHGVVVSSDVKMIKPKSGIYQYLLSHYHLNPAECFFIDDRPENVAAAKALGIDGYVFQGSFEALHSLFP